MEIRYREYAVLLYRIGLAYVFYFIARILFYVFYRDVIEVDGVSELMKISFYGLKFDTTAILYVNILFIFLSIIPAFVNTKRGYQKMLFYVYFVTNGIGYSLNFIDMGYYAFSRSRLTIAVRNLVENEQNKLSLSIEFLKGYWYLCLLFVLSMMLWIWIYKRVGFSSAIRVKNRLSYLIFSVIGMLLFTTVTVFFIRGGTFQKRTIPLTIIDASSLVRIPGQADLVLNSTFTFLRTLGESETYKPYNWFTKDEVYDRLQPVKQYDRVVKGVPNVVIFILESFGREYWGSMNQHTKIKDFVSYTPFLDSLSQHGYIFDRAYANGRISIHAMPAVLAGIPSFKDPFMRSPYVSQPITSVISIAKEKGYDTSFFHGASNGSMGFLGFSRILGFDHYYGRTEYNNEVDYDGDWGIPDEPFLQYMNRVLSHKKEPFLATVFTLSSHHPFRVPAPYRNRFNDGKIPIHNVIRYSDYAISRFFEKAKKEPWFANTIFVFVADHTSQKYYPLYKTPVEADAVPILFYSPNSNWVGVGKSEELAQQIDIYPTLVDLMGYHKPFRSWGRSLFSDKGEKSIILRWIGAGTYLMQQQDYVYTFNGKDVTGIYEASDKSLKNNKKEELLQRADIREHISDMKAFIQDYMDRVINRKLK